MTIVRRRLDPARPPALSAESQARYDSLSDAEALRNAEADPDNPPWTDAELARGTFARQVRRARDGTGLNQAGFAARFHIDPARLQDWELGRVAPDPMALAYLRVIQCEPDAVKRALEGA